jgi:hypothetical protein
VPKTSNPSTPRVAPAKAHHNNLSSVMSGACLPELRTAAGADRSKSRDKHQGSTGSAGDPSSFTVVLIPHVSR